MKKVTFGNVRVINYVPTGKIGTRSARQNEDKLPIAAIIDASIVSNKQPAQHFSLWVKNPREGKNLMESSIHSTYSATETLRILGAHSKFDKSDLETSNFSTSKCFSLTESCILTEDHFLEQVQTDDVPQEDFPTEKQLAAINRHEDLSQSLMMQSGIIDFPEENDLPDEDELIPINPHEGRSLLEESCISARDLKRYASSSPLITDEDLIPRNRHEGRSLLEESCYANVTRRIISEIDSEDDDFVLVSKTELESVPEPSTGYFSGIFSYFKASNA
ncbi:putative orfan [Tupanvirus soda lake]|uniref:Orfan n=2 Tax=Tupanvirus TaxID=2094720 RepID=A0AC62ADP2_9VIRU|nr:putative orfan [Tupanvirus soda lake]QKU35760.1 putative orfan [Tupanvirus soda lake]